MQASIVGLETRSSTELFLRQREAFGMIPCQRVIGAPHRKRFRIRRPRPHALDVERFLVRRVRLEPSVSGQSHRKILPVHQCLSRESARRKARASLRRNADLSRGAAEDVTRATPHTKAQRTPRHCPSGNCRGTSGAVPRRARRRSTIADDGPATATGLAE